jgi:hypothetical protein
MKKMKRRAFLRQGAFYSAGLALFPGHHLRAYPESKKRNFVFVLAANLSKLPSISTH